MNKSTVIIFAAFSLTGCAIGPWEADAVMNGYDEPAECHRDLSGVAAVYVVPESEVRRIAVKHYQWTAGLMKVNVAASLARMGDYAVPPSLSAPIGVPPGVYVAAEMSRAQRATFAHHGQCHLYMAALGKPWVHAYD